eukprot:TRINITY_DN4157_c0_g1_i1.p1 TRINITY_DN4157_c0_g1~~TRINITY_DN4157_c0_g1_i1.p1  ORF type:complete len:225 (-),score=19.87 TRINITY_DN4157_c0_g1_i1:620-1294(-)
MRTVKRVCGRGSLAFLLRRRMASANKERKKAELNRDLKRSNLKDMSELAKKYKPFIADAKLLKGDSAPNIAELIPDTEMTTYAGTLVNVRQKLLQNAPSLLILSMNRTYAGVMADGYRQAFSEAFPLLQIYEIEIPIRWSVKFMGPIVRRFTKAKIPIEIQRTIAISSDSTFAKEARWHLSMINQLYAYANIVDSKGFVRWRATGYITPQEIDSFKTVTKQLLS